MGSKKRCPHSNLAAIPEVRKSQRLLARNAHGDHGRQVEAGVSTTVHTSRKEFMAASNLDQCGGVEEKDEVS